MNTAAFPEGHGANSVLVFSRTLSPKKSRVLSVRSIARLHVEKVEGCKTYDLAITHLGLGKRLEDIWRVSINGKPLPDFHGSVGFVFTAKDECTVQIIEKKRGEILRTIEINC